DFVRWYFMAKLKYAGLCAAGIVLNVACEALCLYLIFEVFVGNPYKFIPYLIGFVICAAAGFLHVQLMNIIRTKLGKKTFGYALAVFVVPMSIAILGVIIPFAANMSISDGMPMLVYSGAILSVIIVSGISTYSFNHFFGAPELSSRETEADLPEIE
ncbi:MAG: hypothetical protein ACI4JZ_03600, partial [Oscillospiraceae bacterium]